MERPRKTWRVAALVPWYHAPMPRCEVRTQRDERCSFSGNYSATRNGRNIACCKVHGDILALNGWKVVRRRAAKVDIYHLA